MRLIESLVPAVGGLMMGFATVFLYFMLAGRSFGSKTTPAIHHARWQVIVWFALGALIGAYMMARLMHRPVHGSVPLVLIGILAGGTVAWLFARK